VAEETGGNRPVNITLGTAGHIDHGKTALIKLLTGCDTDHLKEEKERGMSIELGFAPCRVSDLEVGIVDVPGHENFIKTMVAGATGIDGVIFVIAADDGVMPQTREHLDILTLLGVRHGIVALTKVDAVDAEHQQIVTQEAADYLRGTFLEAAPILPVSNITGQGFPELLDGLKTLLDSIEPKPADGVFRMPVERTFSPKGYGTVVTGIPVAGRVRIGDELTLYPQGRRGRIKNIQVYKHAADTAMVGQCAAINVPQWDYNAISRGDVVAGGDMFEPAVWYLCELSLLPHERLFVKNAASMKFHTGTSETIAAVYLLEGSSAIAGQTVLAQLRLGEPVTAGPGDRFILRTPSPAQTVGGGIIVESLSGRLGRNKPGVLADATLRAAAVRERRSFVEYCIRTADTLATDRASLARRVKLPVEVLEGVVSALAAEGAVTEIASRRLMHRRTHEAAAEDLVAMLRDYHGQRPESPGPTPEAMLEQSRLAKDVFDGVVATLVSAGRLALRKGRLALAEHRERFSSDQSNWIARIEAVFRERAFEPPGADETAGIVGCPAAEAEKVLRILCEQQRLVRVEKLFFHAEAIEKARVILVDYLKKEGRLESVKMKYLLNTTRKYAIPLLDHFDRIGVLRRVGNTRYLK